MIGRRKKAPTQRQPRIDRQKQPAFQYSSNRSKSERTSREQTDQENTATQIRKSLCKFLYACSIVTILIGAIYASILSAEPVLVLDNKQTALRPYYSEDATVFARTGVQSFSKFTLNRKKIADQLQSKYPEMIAVDVTTPLFARRAVIKVEIAKPAVVLTSGSSTYLVNDLGVVMFDTANTKNYIKKESLLQINDQSSTPVQAGKPALTSVQVVFITELKRQSEAKQLPITTASLNAGGGELHIKHSDLPYIVKYNLYEDARKSFGTFIATKEKGEQTRQKPAEYIDVRIPERAYIK